MLTIAIDSMEEHGCGLEGRLAAGKGRHQARFTVCPVLGPDAYLTNPVPEHNCQIDRLVDWLPVQT